MAGEHVPSANDLAVQRTWLANERTMMAWIRTAASLITFGFTIYKFFELESKGAERPDRLLGPHGFALMLIGLGVVALVMADVQHRASVRVLKGSYSELPRSVAGTIAWLVAGLGIVVWLAVLIRI
jgi:putative membrane protein